MNETLSRVERREKPTIMGGRVVTFAERFTTRESMLGKVHHAHGAFEVSASRDFVMVHRAVLRSESEFEAFQEALIRAKAAHLATRGRWGGNG